MTPIESLPAAWQEEIRKIRRENSKLRHERNEARDALVAALTMRTTLQAGR